MKNDSLYFKVAYYGGVINIDSYTITEKKDFGYANIKGMYTNGNGVGIQVNNIKNEKHLKQMCNKSSKVVYECVDKIKEEDEER